ncbi:unnamed protein product, partial [Allacma fusca]
IPINGYMKLVGFGVFHTGVEVYGSEYSCGGHLSAFTGIYDMNPKDAIVLGEDFKFKQACHLIKAPEFRHFQTTGAQDKSYKLFEK